MLPLDECSADMIAMGTVKTVPKITLFSPYP